MKLLIAGGAGFIGSTIASAAIDAGHIPVILDNLVTGRREFCRDRAFYEGDIADSALVERIFAEHPDIAAVVHCAALIVVPDSVADPVRYYRENVAKTLDFVDAITRHGCQRLLFSSSASIYAAGNDFTVAEDSPIAPVSPYARTKAVVEGMLTDIATALPLRVLSLRYFNPIGADPQLRTGLQLPAPSHALGQIIAAHVANRPFNVTGRDWPTRDGSGIRDYIHVWDLALAHIAALERFDTLFPDKGSPSLAINLGTGTGTTVLELLEAFNRVVERPVTTRDAPSRPGDVAGAYTTSGRASELLHWTAQRGVHDGIRDTLHWFAIRGNLLPDLARP